MAPANGVIQRSQDSHAAAAAPTSGKVKKVRSKPHVTTKAGEYKEKPKKAKEESKKEKVVYKEDDFDWSAYNVVEYLEAKKPLQSFAGMDTDEDYNVEIAYKETQLRFGWPKGKRQELYAAQTDAHTKKLMCLHCNTEIEMVGGAEKDVGKAPPIDHCKPAGPWSKRLKKLYDDAGTHSWDVATFTEKAKEAYIAPGLQILHTACNSTLSGSDH